jgi:hypothetical protein
VRVESGSASTERKWDRGWERAREVALYACICLEVLDRDVVDGSNCIHHGGPSNWLARASDDAGEADAHLSLRKMVSSSAVSFGHMLANRGGDRGAVHVAQGSPT